MKRKFITISTAAAAMLLSVASCGPQGGGSDTPTKKFEFTISLESGKSALYVGQADKILITEKNAPEAARNYTATLTLSDGSTNVDDYITATYTESNGTKAFTLNCLKETGKDKDGNDIYVSISVKEASVTRAKQLSFRILNNVTPASAAYNFVSDANARTEILGKLEEYAMENFLTGISLFENGGWVRYSSRVNLPTTEYITGFGTGLLSEGSLDGTLPYSVPHPTYLQSAMSSDPLTINAWDASGSQVSDLNGYITSSFWGTRKTAGKNEYEWYPVLAKDTVDGKANNRPVRNEPENDLKLYKNWKIYVKTGAEEGLAYRTASSKNSEFDKRLVDIKDYEFAFQMLLTGNSANDVSRGIELAADTTYGIKGAQQFYNRSGKMKPNNYDTAGEYNQALDNLWKQMQDEGTLGIKTGSDDNGSYIAFELINPIDEFTAMYTLSSNLYSPIPKQFLQAIGNGDYTEGRKLYGTFPDSSTSAADITLSVGPYYLEEWNKNQDIAFKQNEDWFEVKAGTRYHIPGVRITKIDTSKNDEAIYERFEHGELDSVGIPKSKMDTAGKDTRYQDIKSTGDSTFKLNVNSCTQERWNELFGSNGSIKKGTDNEYKVKPWMSNKNFLKGLFWSIDRKSFAEARGVNPSINYLAGTYMSDPENSKSYNETTAHANAIRNFHNINDKGVDDYGYNPEIASRFFKKAVEELTASGDIVIPNSGSTTIDVDIWWMYPTDKRDYGSEITNYFKTAFEDNSVSGGKVKINFNQDAEPQWDQVYSEHLQVGKFDLGFGAISGNTYNPLNFLEVLKSDNSSGFTLNWGADTGVVDPVNPIMYNNKSWSFDALWAAADHGTIASAGKDVNPVFDCYKTGVSSNNLYEGGSFYVPFSFVELEDTESVTLQVTRIQIALRGAASITLVKDVDYTWDAANKRYVITISAALGKTINDTLFEANDLQKQVDKATDPETIELLKHPFRDDTYDFYWNIEVYYSMSIRGSGYTTENVFNVYGSQQEQEADRK